jgi:hypothetical protein
MWERRGGSLPDSPASPVPGGTNRCTDKTFCDRLTVVSCWRFLTAGYASGRGPLVVVELCPVQPINPNNAANARRSPKEGAVRQNFCER